MDYIEKQILLLPYKQYKETGNLEVDILYEENFFGISRNDYKRVLGILSEKGSIVIIQKDDLHCRYKLTAKAIREFDSEPDLN